MSVKIITPQTKNDFLALSDLISALALHHGQSLRPFPEKLMEDFLAEAPWVKARMIKIDNEYVGYITWFHAYRTQHASKIIDLQNIYILPEHRKKQLGTLLYRALLDEAVKENCDGIALTVDEKNEGSQAFFESQGFKQNKSQGPLKYLLKKSDMENIQNV